MFDHEFYHTLTGKYTYMADPLPIIDHPVVALPGNRFYVLSMSAAADGTRAEDWYLVDNRGVRPVCTCRAYSPKTGCKHCAEVTRQADALHAAMTARWAAEKAARQEGRAA